MTTRLICNAQYVLLFIAGASISTAQDITDNEIGKGTVDANAVNPSGLISRCPKLLPEDVSKKLQPFGVLPGYGWDNLRNRAMGFISQLPYKECAIKYKKYLIPDNVNIISHHKSGFSSEAEIIHHSSEYKSVTSQSVNVEAGGGYWGVTISGKFSSSFAKNKALQSSSKTSVARIQARYRSFTVGLKPDSGLDPGFKQSLMDIAGHLGRNDTDAAEYQAQMLVRNYGTHIITSVDAGAMFVGEDSFQSKSSSDSWSDDSAISLAVKVKYADIFELGVEFNQNVSESVLNSYEETVKNTRTKTYGGPLWGSKMDFNEWLGKVESNLVTIDRTGDPLYLHITKRNIPELPEPVVYNLARMVYEAIKEYYSYNTHRGCTNPRSPHFNLAANVDDKSCSGISSNFSFGGIYQKCTITSGKETAVCDGLDYNNIMTKSKSCPKGYEDINLVTDRFQRAKVDKKCDDICPGYEGKLLCQSCWTEYPITSAVTEAHWCGKIDTKKENSGLLFGGAFTDNVNNPVTDTKGCPRGFVSVAIGEHASFCVAKRTHKAQEDSIPFGGFYSCDAGNPLLVKDTSMVSNELTKACPEGFSATIAAIVDTCDVHFCSKFVPLGGVAKIHLPPYFDQPIKDTEILRGEYVEGHTGQIWEKSENDTWVETGLSKAYGRGEVAGLSNGTIVGIAVAVGILLVALAFGAVHISKKHETQVCGTKQSMSHDDSVTSEETIP